MITEQQVEKAIHYLADTDEPCARAKALVKALEHGFKTVAASEFVSFDGPQGERQQRAYASQAYKDHTSKYEEAITDYEIMANKRKRAELTIDVWRSINANRRQG